MSKLTPAPNWPSPSCYSIAKALATTCAQFRNARGGWVIDVPDAEGFHVTGIDEDNMGESVLILYSAVKPEDSFYEMKELNVKDYII